MPKEYEVVLSTKELEEKVPINTIGTVLMVFDDDNMKKYEVEFVNDQGDFLALLTVEESDIKLNNILS